MYKRKAAVILSGCGFKDGSEITESVLSMVELDRQDIEQVVFAPDVDFTAMNHITGTSDGRRNVMVESARIARGNIKPLSQLNAEGFDALVMPGGFGAIQNLSNLANNQANPEILPESIIKSFWQAKKPIAAICIAPTLVSFSLRNKHISLTLGLEDANNMIRASGNVHVSCDSDSHVMDELNFIISTPAFNNRSASIAAVAQGIQEAIGALKSMFN